MKAGVPRRLRITIIAATVMAAISTGVLANAVDSPGDGEPVREGENLFQERCSVCHDAGIPGLPTREKLAGFTKPYIVNALTKGLMMEQGYGLSDEQVNALAEYVSKTPE